MARRESRRHLAIGGDRPIPHSFLRGTRILGSDSETKSIEDVELGDKLARRPSPVVAETGKTRVRAAASTIVTGDDDKHFVELTLETEEYGGCSRG
ncbi:hypothetical protein [Streptomyces sp. NPDC048428]|uniref:hypothetical protein n=1 Tax=Streptomyces sp. NPDC048428 TaxID=3154503 RepID=UPI00342FB5C2